MYGIAWCIHVYLQILCFCRVGITRNSFYRVNATMALFVTSWTNMYLLLTSIIKCQACKGQRSVLALWEWPLMDGAQHYAGCLFFVSGKTISYVHSGYKIGLGVICANSKTISHNITILWMQVIADVCNLFFQKVT